MLYDFRDLKYFVQSRLGVDPDTINSNFKPITKTFTRAELEKNVEFERDGIYYIDKKGVKHKGFLYIEAGYSREVALRNGWKTIVPKFHVVNCFTIQQKKSARDFDGKYVFSNEAQTMKDLDGLTKDLEICGNCLKLHVDNIYNKMTTTEYRDEVILNGDEEGNFMESELPKDVTTDFWGYTPEWDETSKNYRMNKKFTCEDCGINLSSNYANGYYLETHHLDGNKKNNDDYNLKCLCVLCHANIDKIHQDNYSRGAGKQKLRDFINLFDDELRRIGNKYLGKYY